MIDTNAITIEDFPEEFRAIATIIGLQACIKLIRSFQGCQLYVPKLETIIRHHKYRQIHNDFNQLGNFKRVAVKYGLSESRIRQIIKDEQQKRRAS